MSSSAAATLDAAVAASACPGIGRALRAHEAVHLIFCVTIGFFPYEEMHAADRAQEEVEAYAAQIKVLREILDSLKPKCKSYRASGRTADLVYSGVICSLEQPFTVSGSIINYKFNFTPSSPTSGTVNISAAGMMVTGAGGGTYNIEGADTDKPRIAITASVVGHSPVGSRTGSGTVYIDLTPLETNECDQKR